MLNKVKVLSANSFLTSQEKFASNAFHYLRIFLNYAYYLGLSPFRIKQISSKLVLHTNKFQKVGAVALKQFKLLIAFFYYLYS